MEEDIERAKKEKKDNTPYILNTSSNLLGLCFIVLTSLKVLNLSETSIIDELITIAIIMFMASIVLSFLYMRRPKAPGIHYEKAADYIFLAGLFFLFVTTLLITFNIIK
ncbi:MAG: hypothetical protein H0W62_07080 [Chitinophagales bacterium]|nr:hypothetical protein [Chitinophagales bacterium]